MTWALTLPHADDAEPQVLASASVKFDAANARITALQVGALTETVS